MMAVQTGSCPSAKVRPANESNESTREVTHPSRQTSTNHAASFTCANLHKDLSYFKPGLTCAKNAAKCHAVLVYSVPMRVT